VVGRDVVTLTGHLPRQGGKREVSGNRKRILALVFGALVSVVVALVWGLVLRAFDDVVLNCVKGGAAAGGGTFVVCVAIIVLFPFSDDPGVGLPPQVPAPPRTPTA
jgi:hypothetical protein